MIDVTRLNGARFILNAELIRTVESSPDTVITLVGGEHLVVLEPSDEIVRKVLEYRRHLRTLMPAS